MEFLPDFLHCAGLPKGHKALLDYAIGYILRKVDNNAPDTFNRLSDLLLIDLDYSPCSRTTEIQQANESLHTFIIRSRTGQEQNLPDLDESKLSQLEEEWSWMRRYILWEAAQKVYLFPENFIMPQLRDNKSQLYGEFEDKVSEGEVTQDLVKQSLLEYFEKLKDFSSLKVVGTFYYKDLNVLYIFAQSRVSPDKIFYRTLKNQTIWSHWISISEEIIANRVFPYIAYNRIYLFWIETEEEEKETENGDSESQIFYTHKLCFIHESSKGKWSKKVETDIVAQGNSEWSINRNQELLSKSPNDHIDIVLEIGQRGWFLGTRDNNLPIFAMIKASGGPTELLDLRTSCVDYKISCNDVVLPMIPADFNFDAWSSYFNLNEAFICDVFHRISGLRVPVSSRAKHIMNSKLSPNWTHYFTKQFDYHQKPYFLVKADNKLEFIALQSFTESWNIRVLSASVLALIL